MIFFSYLCSMIYLNDHLSDFDVDAALPFLSDQRREQCLRFKYELGRKTCALAYLLLCEGLRREYGITSKPVFEYGEHGKPSIVGLPDVHFNLSHCREAVLCVLSDRPVGVDVESVREYKESLVRYTMNDAEVRQIEQSADAALEFTRLWTKKEAVLKLTGRGIIDDMKHVLDTVRASELTTVVGPEARYVYSILYQSPSENL